jgi:hypothetical protein
MNKKNIFIGLFVALLVMSFASAVVTTDNHDNHNNIDLSKIECKLSDDNKFSPSIFSITHRDDDKKTCEDFNAICVPKDNRNLRWFSLTNFNHNHDDENHKGVCACDKGYSFDKEKKACVPDNNVPEFGVLAGAVALIGALGIFIYKRK